MTPTFIVSSNINAVAHQDETLTVRFNNGSVYEYESVPHSVFAALVAAESPGKFFYAFVRKAYANKVLEHDPFQTESETA